MTGYRDFTRAVIAKTLASPAGEVEFATKRWGPSSGALTLLRRAAVSAVSSGDYLSTGGLGDDEFFNSVVEASIPGRMAGLRRTAFNVRQIRLTANPQGYWVSEGKAVALSRQSLAGVPFPRRKIGVIIVQTTEALVSISPVIEAGVETDLRNAFVSTFDQAFIDAGNAGISGSMPAAVTYGASSTASASNPGTDLAWLVENFAGDLSAAYFVSDPTTFAQMASYRDASGAAMYPDIGPRGGSLLGIPALSSRWSPRDSNGGQLALVDPSGISFASDTLTIERSTAATLEMADDPTGAALTPAAATTSPVNLFQADAVALKGTLSANWEVQRPGSVSVITGASYATAAA